jgi:hypothetical protein
MGSILDWNGKPNIPDALRRGHDEARTELVRAAMLSGRITNDEMICPAVVLIGDYLQQKLKN